MNKNLTDTQMPHNCAYFASKGVLLLSGCEWYCCSPLAVARALPNICIRPCFAAKEAMCKASTQPSASSLTSATK